MKYDLPTMLLGRKSIIFTKTDFSSCDRSMNVKRFYERKYFGFATFKEEGFLSLDIQEKVTHEPVNKSM